MVRFLSAVLLFSAVSASASPAIPSFEFSAAQLQTAVAALRGAQIKTKAGDLGPRISRLAWDLERFQRDASQLRTDLRFLQQRLQRPDSNLRWDVQRFTRELSQLTRDAQWRLSDLRFLSAEAVKDQALVGPATQLLNSARWLKSETNWLAMDARFATWDFRRAGFTFEAMDLDRDSRDVDEHAQDLQDEADKLLTKVRPALAR